MKISFDLLEYPCAQAFVEACARIHSNATAVVNSIDTDRSLTFAEFAEVVLDAAAVLEKHVRGKVVLVQGVPDDTMIVDIVALLCSGAIIHPVAPTVKSDALPGIVAESGAVAVRVRTTSKLPDMGDAEILEAVPWTGTLGRRPCGQSPDDVAFHFTTSGTSGLPKTAVLTHRAIFFSVSVVSDQFMENLVIAPGSRIVPVLPVHHVLGTVVTMLTPLYHGLTLCCSRMQNNLPKVMQHYQPDILVVVPMILEGFWKLSHSPRFKASGMGLRELLGGKIARIICGGAPLPQAIANTFGEEGVDILNGYGMTECGGVISCQVRPADGPSGSVGRPVAEQIKVRTVDGELQVSGGTLMAGYLCDGVLDTSMIKDGWLLTGDIAELDAQGRIVLIGRSKNIIIMADGNNISPEQIELELRESMVIEDVVVTSEPLGVRNTEVLVATCIASVEAAGPAETNMAHGLVLEGDVPRAVLEIVAEFNRHAPAHSQIRIVRMARDDVPRTPLGKIMRRRLVREVSPIPAVVQDNN